MKRRYPQDITEDTPTQRIGPMTDPTLPAVVEALEQLKADYDSPCENVNCHNPICIVARALLAGLRPSEPPDTATFRCYHCDEVFSREEAADHFGDNMQGRAACQIKASDEGLLGALRRTEMELESWRSRALAAEEEEPNVEAFRSDLARYFEGRRSVQEAFFLLDEIRGRAIAAEERLAMAAPPGTRDDDLAQDYDAACKQIAVLEQNVRDARAGTRDAEPAQDYPTIGRALCYASLVRDGKTNDSTVMESVWDADGAARKQWVEHAAEFLRQLRRLMQGRSWVMAAGTRDAAAEVRAFAKQLDNYGHIGTHEAAATVWLATPGAPSEEEG